MHWSGSVWISEVERFFKQLLKAQDLRYIFTINLLVYIKKLIRKIKINRENTQCQEKILLRFIDNTENNSKMKIKQKRKNYKTVLRKK